MGSVAYQTLKNKVGANMAVAGSKIAGVGTKFQAACNTLASSAATTPGVAGGLKIGADGLAASGAASLIMIGGSAFVLSTGVDQVARHKIEGYVNSDDPNYKKEPFKMQPPLEAWFGKPK